MAPGPNVPATCERRILAVYGRRWGCNGPAVTVLAGGRPAGCRPRCLRNSGRIRRSPAVADALDDAEPHTCLDLAHRVEGRQGRPVPAARHGNPRRRNLRRHEKAFARTPFTPVL